MFKTFKENGAKARLLVRCFNENIEAESDPQFEFRALESTSRTLLSTPLDMNPRWRNFISQNIKEFNPDLIIVREMFLSALVADLVKDTNIPVLMDMAENYPSAMKSWKKYNSSALKKFMIHKLNFPIRKEKKAVGKMDGIIVVCEEQIERLAEEYKFDKDRIVCIYNSPTKDLHPHVCGKEPNDTPIFIHHGMMTSEKSLTSFLYACKILSDKGINFEVILPGFGDCEDDYKNLCKDLSINNHIIFYGAYSGEELGELLYEADYGIIPYELNDFNNYTIHNKLFEYFALGLPVVVTPMIPTARIVQSTGSGIVAKSASPNDIADAMVAMLNADCREMMEAALKAHLTYNWDVEAERLLGFVNKLEKRNV
jgi:glycosyltransferase involved in cell wall biosynthesis